MNFFNLLEFSETIISILSKLFANLNLISPPPTFYPIIFLEYTFLVTLPFRKEGGKTMNRFKANQKLLFKAETVFNLKPLEKYE